MSFPLPILDIPLMDGGTSLTLTATTGDAAQTVTLQRITPSTNIVVLWGDGTSSSITAGNTGTTTHEYADAGTYTIRIGGAGVITYLDLRDAQLVFDSTALRVCTSLTTLILRFTAAGTYAFNSANIARLRLTYLHLQMEQAGTYAFDSADIAAMALTYVFVLFNQAGTYAFDSADIAGKALTYVYLYLNQAGTYAFDSADLSGMALTYLSLVFHNSVATTIAQTDFDSFPAVATAVIQMALSETEVDAILAGFYDGAPTKTVANGTMNLAGENAAPSGTYQAQCPPTTGKEFAYELLNDSCDVFDNHWATMTVTGGLP